MTNYPVVVLLSLISLSIGLPLGDFYPFGSENGDASLAPSDDDSLRVELSTVLPFYGTGYNSIFVSNFHTNYVMQLMIITTSSLFHMILLQIDLHCVCIYNFCGVITIGEQQWSTVVW